MDHLKLISIECSDFFRRNESFPTLLMPHTSGFSQLMLWLPSLSHLDTKHQSTDSLPYYSFHNFAHTLHYPVIPPPPSMLLYLYLTAAILTSKWFLHYCNLQTEWSNQPPGPAWHPSHQQRAVPRSLQPLSGAGYTLLPSLGQVTSACSQHTIEGSVKNKIQL